MDETNAKEQINNLVENKVCISFKLNPIFELDMSECELLGELRGLLSEHPLVKLHPNYVFVCKGKKLKEFEFLSSQLSGEDTNISINIELSEFNERTANEHIFECCSLFLGPHKYLSESYTDFSILMGKHDVIRECIEQQDVSRISEFVDSYDKIDPNVLCRDTFNKQESAGEGLFKKLAYSEHNPVEPGIGTLGDLFYLDFIDKHGKYSCITVNSRGLFRNESTMDNFNDKPNTRAYMSLLELLGELSGDLAYELKMYLNIKDNFQLNNIAQTDFYGDFKGEWLRNPIRLSPKNHSLLNLKTRLSNQIYGKSTTMYRDWVEEFHNCRSLPAQDTLQQLHKVKVLRKTNQDFTKAAEELTRAVVSQRILPLNPNENRVESCYVYNNLFATYAIDKTDWEVPKSETAPTTYSAVNTDVRNLGQILEHDIRDVNVINTAAIDYMGCRVIVQSVVQGILHFDQKTWNCYGSIDDGKSMNFDAEFHNIMEKLVDYFHLTKNNKYVDEEGKEFQLHGSPEVKGIKAGDNRKYVMDLLRLSPRDTNYTDTIKHESCLLRPELIINFLFFANFEENMIKQKDEEKTNEESKLKEDKTTDQNNQVKEIKNNQVESKTENKMPKGNDYTIFEAKNRIGLNPSLFTQIQSCNDNKEAEIQELQKVGDFLVKQMIPTFINTVVNTSSNTPLDVYGLTESMHRLGINVRYINKIYEGINKKAYPHMIKLIDRFVLLRSFKKILRQVALEEDVQTFVECFAQYLNILLGNDLVRKMVDDKINTQGNKKSVENKKKKKNKKKMIDLKVGAEISPNLRVTSDELLENISKIANERYGYSKDLLSDYNNISCLKSDLDKLSFLREVCLVFGAVLKAKNYDFSPNERQPEYPIKPRDVLTFKPITKAPEFHIEGLKYNYKNAEHELSKKNLESAYQLFKGCQQLIVSAYGILNPDFIYVTNKLASIAHLSQDLDTAIKTQLYTVKVCEKVYGIIHPITALNISDLSTYFIEKKLLPQTINLHSKALKIYDLVGSSLNSNSLLCLHELQMMTEESKNHNASCAIMQELLNRNGALFGEIDERLLYSLGKLAQLKAELGDFKQASLLQARHIFILKQLLKNTQGMLNEKYKEAFKKKLQDSEKLKNYYVNKNKILGELKK